MSQCSAHLKKSHCIEEDRGCLCDTCPVHAEYNLNREEYCLKDGGNLGQRCLMGFDEEDDENKTGGGSDNLH